MGCDVTTRSINGEISVVLRVKMPKEKRMPFSETKIELFALHSFFCPVMAKLKWQKAVGKDFDPNLPAFTLHGKNYTKSDFNNDIRFLLCDIIDYSKNTILSHSFRSGMATALARAGYHEQEIQLLGRWSSQAYLAYTKLGRMVQKSKMLQMNRDLCKLAKSWSPGLLNV